MKKKTKRKKLDNKLLTIWKAKVKAGGCCEYCGSTNILNAHHFYGKRALNTRYDLDNGFCLCVGHHTFNLIFSAHQTPADFVDWAIEKRGIEWYNRIKLKHRIIVDWSDADLEDLLEELKK